MKAENSALGQSVLLAVSSLLRSESDVDDLLNRLLDLVAEAMKADRATLFLVDRDRQELYSRVAHLPEISEIRLPIGQGIAGYVAATGKPSITHEASEDKRFSRGIDTQTGYHTSSLLAAPIFRSNSEARTEGQRVVGVLEVVNKRDGLAFNEADCQLLEALARQVAEALAQTHLDNSHERPSRYNRLVGASPAMMQVYDIIGSAAGTDATTLLLGESGTGKELVARAIHSNSKRKTGPFVKVDCTAIPEGLIEAELFGHEKGSFTGADRTVIGKCEQAAGGTLFLDEIGDMPLTAQAKLLRFVQDRELERVGGRLTIHADVRVVAATHRDLEKAVLEGQFRKDLFYRLKVIQIRLPALRERGPDDIAQLARHFLRLYSRRHDRPARAFDSTALSQLLTQSWPGNIRELEHCIESAVVLCPTIEITMQHLSLPQLAEANPNTDWEDAPDSVPSGLTLADVEKRYILRTLAECGGNRTRTAAALDIGRNTLVRKLKQFKLD